MGSGLASNLAQADYQVYGFDTETSRIDEVKSNGIISSSIDEISQVCDTVVLCLPHPDVTRNVLFDTGLLGKKSTISQVIETSTLNPEILHEAQEKLTSKNINFLSAPMIGGKSHASSRKVVFLAEGNDIALQNGMTPLQAMGEVRFMGAIPSGTIAKIVFNLCRYTNVAVGIEAYRLAKKYGANTTSIHELLTEQSLDNFGQVWAEDLLSTFVADSLYQPSNIPEKDLSMMSAMMKNKEMDSSLVKAVDSVYKSLDKHS